MGGNGASSKVLSYPYYYVFLFLLLKEKGEIVLN